MTSRCLLVAAVFSMLFTVAPARAKDHPAAPLRAFDPAADVTDLYLFRSPPGEAEAADTVTIIANVWPFEEPGNGVAWSRFSDDVLYEIKIDTDGDARDDITWAFKFATELSDDPNRPVTQTALVTRKDKKGKEEQKDVPVAGEDGNAPLTGLTARGGGRVFLGLRDDPFFGDLPSVFERLRAGANAEKGAPKGIANGIDRRAGHNVHSIAIQLPISSLIDKGGDEAGAGALPAHAKGAIIGVWATASRPRETTLSAGKPPHTSGRVQVARRGLPLFEELLLPVAERLVFNGSTPREDESKLKDLVDDPPLAKAIHEAWKAAVPAAGRTDLSGWMRFDVGIAPLDLSGLRMADVLRVDLSVPSVAEKAGSRLGLLSGDAAGFPNGRRLGDDVVDVMLRILSGVLCTKDKTCDVGAFALPLGDGVDHNDRPFLDRFPYLAAPWTASSMTPAEKVKSR